MSDGQAFLLLLLGFYLVECCALVTPGSRVFVRGFGRHYRVRRCLLDLGGIRRQLYFLSFLPWPGRAHIAAPPGPHTRPLTTPPPNYRRYLDFLNRSAGSLAARGLLMWIIFFVLIPVTYYFDPFDPRVLLLAGLGYLLLFWQTVRFFALHRRFYPERQEERLKHTLTMWCLPWHGMKAASHLVLRPKLPLPAIHFEALLLSPEEFRKRARLAWRRARFSPEATGAERRDLEKFLESTGIDRSTLRTRTPTLEEGQRYCPVCHTTFQSQAETCRDCGGIPLRGQE